MKTDKKIEEIYMDTLKLTDDEWVAKYGEGNGYHEAFETLIQQEREEAVRRFDYYLSQSRKEYEMLIKKEAIEGFVRWCRKKDRLDSGRSFRTYWTVFGIENEAEEYLESEGK